MDYLPIFIDVRTQACVVVGGGEVASRKTALLLRAGARVTIVAPELAESLADRHERGEFVWLKAPFTETVLAGAKLVFAATDDLAVNQQVSAAANRQGIPVNVADQPELCSFVLPSILDRSPIVAAISSGGASPVLARVLRMRLEMLIPPAYGRLAALAAKFRQRAKETLPDTKQRRQFWERVLQGKTAELVFAGQEEQAELSLKRELTESDSTPRGLVFLIGAGPGAPDLLTLRALRLIQEADTVVYDRLVSQDVLDLVRRDAELIYAGKQRNQHTLQQTEINQLLADLAKQGKRVVRLKGGDPFIFGRGGEEIETLLAEGIAFQVVPGITAASGCAAYAGIPLTHRDYAQSVTFLTGHLKDGRVIQLDWAKWAKADQTLVFYMSLQGLDEVCRQLISHGSPPDLPAALVQQGTTAHQVVLTGTLTSLPEKVRQTPIRAPTLLIIGRVVELRGKLNWFEAAPVGTLTRPDRAKNAD